MNNAINGRNSAPPGWSEAGQFPNAKSFRDNAGNVKGVHKQPSLRNNLSLERTLGINEPSKTQDGDYSYNIDYNAANHTGSATSENTNSTLVDYEAFNVERSIRSREFRGMFNYDIPTNTELNDMLVNEIESHDRIENSLRGLEDWIMEEQENGRIRRIKERRKANRSRLIFKHILG